MVKIDFSHREKTEALCMKDTLYDLLIEDIDRSILPNMSHYSAAAIPKA